jgi:hypothetical protein
MMSPVLTLSPEAVDEDGDYSIFTGFWYGSRRAFVVEC